MPLSLLYGASCENMHSISDAPLSAEKANQLNYMRREFPALLLVVSVLPVKTPEIR